MKKVVLIVFIFAILPLISGSYIYGDIYIKSNGEANFFVESDVDVRFDGISFENNNLNGKTFDLNSKSGKIWDFSLNLGKYDNILLDIHLPSNLNYIKSIEGVDNAINFDDKTISLIDGNTNLIFSVGYELNETKDFSWLYFLIVIIVIALIVYFVFKFTKKKRRVKGAFPYLNENEEKIIKKLMKEPMRMKQLREALKIPKASFTRYVINLEKKKLLVREGDSKNKVLKLK